MATNFTDSALNSTIRSCLTKIVSPSDEFFEQKRAMTLASNIINGITFPSIIILNALVIWAVKTKQQLQNNYNVLLACLAGTDLFVGLIAQPIYLAQGIFYLSDTTPQSTVSYCLVLHQLGPVVFAPSLASIQHLALLSVERYIALKYTYRYSDIMTKNRLKAVVVFIWFNTVIVSISARVLRVPYTFTRVMIATFFSASLAIILFCHITVYFVTHRHMMQIKLQQISREATSTFFKEKKALITTSVIIALAFVSYLPSVISLGVGNILSHQEYSIDLLLSSRLIISSIMKLNSLCNPILYCVRSKDFRKALKDIVKCKKNAFH